MHDEGLTRLRAMADAARIDLDADARERVARRVGDRGPALVRHAHRMRQLSRAGAGVVALGIVAAVVSLQRAGSRDDALAGQPVPVKQASPALAAATPSPACAARGEAASVASTDGAAGAQRVAFGAAGLVVAEAGTTMWVDAHDACRLRVRLLDGKLSVHAADLGGGELRVVTPSGEVRVHGTKFAVAHSAEELVVDVEEGRVSVVRGGQVLAASLTAGQRLRARPSPAQGVVEALPAAARDGLLRALAELPAAGEQTPPPAAVRAPRPEASDARSVQSLVDEAEALWRAGEEARARARFRQAGALHGPTAEAAWLALARRELALDRTEAAQDALDERAARFGVGSLDGEAAGIAFRVALRSGDAARIRRRAELLRRDHPTTPQGRSAAQWLQAHPSR